MKEFPLEEIERLEKKYLDKYYYFLKFAEEEMLEGFQTKYKIKDDWIDKWDPDQEGKGISDFATGAERIVYALLNGKGIGNPNSSPIGSDLFFEVKDAFIHIDLKTVQTRNIGDYTRNIFVGNNQNSYLGKLDVAGKEKIYDEACLPSYYTLKKNHRKVCLTYFITILYEEKNLEIININILCMPNGALYDVYGKAVLSAGKSKHPKGNPKRTTHSKTVRFNWSKCSDFKLLPGNPKRIRVIYMNPSIDDATKKSLVKLYELYDLQS